MPIYEYYCSACNLIFERLRPASRASEPEPCIECDLDAERLMPTSVNSFIVRDGIPRRIPDRGKFWHHEVEVSAPVNKSIQAGEHPELFYKEQGPDRPPTVEEEERFADAMEQSLKRDAERYESDLPIPIDQYEQHQISEFQSRVARTADMARAQRIKRPNSQVTPRTISGKHETSRAATPKPPARKRGKRTE